MSLTLIAALNHACYIGNMAEDTFLGRPFLDAVKSSCKRAEPRNADDCCEIYNLTRSCLLRASHPDRHFGAAPTYAGFSDMLQKHIGRLSVSCVNFWQARLRPYLDRGEFAADDFVRSRFNLRKQAPNCECGREERDSEGPSGFSSRSEGSAGFSSQQESSEGSSGFSHSESSSQHKSNSFAQDRLFEIADYLIIAALLFAVHYTALKVCSLFYFICHCYLAAAVSLLFYHLDWRVYQLLCSSAHFIALYCYCSRQRRGGAHHAGNEYIKRVDPTFDKKGNMFYYHVPGDGFCGIHSALAHLPGSNYLENLAYFRDNKWEESLLANLVRPLVLAFSNSKLAPAGFGQYVSNDAEVSVKGMDEMYRQDAIETRKVKAGGNPANYSIAFISAFSKWLGLELTIGIKISDDADILLQNGHYEPGFIKKRAYKDYFNAYVERLVAAANALVPCKKEADRIITTQRTLALLHGSIGPVDYAPRQEGQTAQTLRDQGVIVSDKKVASTVDVKKELLEKVEKEFRDKQNDIQTAEEKKKLKMASHTGILPNGKVQFITNYTGSARFNDFVEGHAITKSAKPERYGHPFLRTVSNWYWLAALAEGMKSKHKVILDVASKYHHLSKFMQYAECKKQVIGARPGLFKHDKAFNERHAAWTSNVIEIDRSMRHVFGPDYTPLDDVFYVMNDCLYYKDVLEGLRNTTGNASGIANLIVYPHTAGTFNYHDGEGDFTVFADGTVTARPKDNPTVYNHPIQDWARSESFTLLRKDAKLLHFVPEHEVDVGGGAFFISYRMFTDDGEMKPRQPVRVTGEYKLNLLDFHISQKFTRLSDSKPVFERVDRKAVKKTITYVPPKPLFDLLVPNVRWRDFEAKFDFSGPTYMSFQKFGSIYDKEDIERTVMCILLDDAKARREYEGWRADPRNFLTNVGDFIPGYNFDPFDLGLIFSLLYAPSMLVDILTSILFGTIGIETKPAFSISLDLFVLSCYLIRGYIMHTGEFEHSHALTWSDWIDFFVRRMRGGAIKESHYTAHEGNRLYWPMGNANVLIQKKVKTLLCTCKKTYQAVFKRLNNAVTHFGACKINLESSIYMRQFNALQIPDEDLGAQFLRYVKARMAQFAEAAPRIIESLDVEYSFDYFLKNSAPRKRKTYQRAWADVQDGHWGDTISFFSKTNEVHVNNDSARPRNIGCFPETFTVVGAYYARMMIQVAKKFFPGFTSGMNLEQLGRHLEKARVVGNIGQPNWYMSDGAGFDASQWQVYIDHIDHVIGPHMYDLLSIKSEVSPFYKERIKNSLFSRTYKCKTARGDSFTLLGSVPSGHPLRTTLFNTIRTILYQEFLLVKADVTGLVFASGDDSLVFTEKPIDPDFFKTILSDQLAGKAGIGILMKDFKAGHLDEMEFLSKNLITDGYRIEVYRRSEKVANSGLYSNSLSKKMTRGIFAAMQAAQLADLPSRLQNAAERFRQLALNTVLPKWAVDILQFDWSYRLYMARTEYRLDNLFYFLHPPREALYRGGGRALESAKNLLLSPPKILHHCQHMKMQLKRTAGPKRAPTNKTAVQRIDPKQSQVVVVRQNKKNVGQMNRLQKRSNKMDYGSMLNSSEKRYLKSVIDPFSAARSKIPNIYPIETSTLSWHTQVDVTVPAAGNAVITLQPWSISQTLVAVSRPSSSSDESEVLSTSSLVDLLFNKPPLVSSPGDLIDRGYVIRDLGDDIYYVKVFRSDGVDPLVNTVVNRFRVVNAGLKVVNSSAATTRSGSITYGHSLVDPQNTPIEEFRQLATSHTQNMDSETVSVYIPHDPDCYNFYFFEVISVYRKTSETSYAFDGFSENFAFFDLNSSSSTGPGLDLQNNNNYVCITGAPNQPISIILAVNLEIVPNRESYTYLQPAADCKGSPTKAQEALSCAPRSDSLWDGLLGALKDTGGAALRALGNAALEAVPDMATALFAL